MRKTVILLCQLLLLCGLAISELVQVQVMSRHCDRTPWKMDNIIPKDPIDWRQATGYGYGELTGLGMSQCFQLGEAIRNRYLNATSNSPLSGIASNYLSSDYLFRSSAVDRTVQSAWSLSMALFPQSGPLNDLNKQPALPFRTQAVPILSNAIRNDLIFRGYEKCPTITEKFKNKLNKQEYKQLVEKHRSFMDEMYALSGHPNAQDLSTFYVFADTVQCQAAHNLLNIQGLKDNLEKITQLGDVSHFLFFDRDVQGNLGGGQFVSTVVNNMHKMVTNSSDKYRFIHFSGHDSTIQAILSALRLSTDHPELQQLPPYGSAIFFELHKEDGKYYVQVVFKRQFDGSFTQYQLKSLGGSGCAENCSFESFERLARMDAIPSDWCSDCGNTDVDVCLVSLVETARTQNIVMVIILPGLAALVIALCIVIAILVMRSRQQQYQTV